ncbi:MAG: glutamate ABC transporter substrate-binding protein [Mycobacterium sp.]|jgi:polar amino acid transport system substrate-binding protein
MSALRKWATATVAALAVITGCAQPADPAMPAVPTLAPPTPAGMEVLPLEPPRPPDSAAKTCDRTASLRPFSGRAAADAAVASIRKRGRLLVGLDIGSNLFSFRDPVTSEITGFDVDIAGEVARDIFGKSSAVEYRILSSADRITALQTNAVDIVVKTMTITCERREKVNFSTPYFVAYQRILAPRTSDIAGPQDLSGKRVCVARGTTSLQKVQQIDPPPTIVTVVTWADCLVALQQHDVDAISTDDAILAGLVAQDPYLHIVGPNLAEEPYGIGINLTNTPLVRFVNATLDRIRNDGTWDTLYRRWLTVLGPAPGPPTPRYLDR